MYESPITVIANIAIHLLPMLFICAVLFKNRKTANVLAFIISAMALLALSSVEIPILYDYVKDYTYMTEHGLPRYIVTTKWEHFCIKPLYYYPFAAGDLILGISVLVSIICLFYFSRPPKEDK